jgi:tRNA-dihydrouridine synthase B
MTHSPTALPRESELPPGPPTGLRIGSMALPSPVLLAPMAGFTDLPFRDLVRDRGGLGLGCTEMIRPGGLLYGREKKKQWILATSPQDTPLGWQIYGKEPAMMAEAARWLQDHGAPLIDLNMGCPQKKIASRGAGAGLLKTPDLAVEIAERVVKAVSVPVTAKIRLGWDPGRLVGLELGRRLAATGIAALTVHGRTASQGYSGEADWAAIAAIAASLPGLPVIGNGDINNAELGAARLAGSGCAAIMIGRAALRNPWIIRDTARAAAGLPPLPPPGKAEVLALAMRHFDMHCALYGELKGPVLFRKWIPLYWRALLKMEKPAMVKLLTLAGPGELRSALASIPV